jgi:DNA uptake protein ComE-like DNA-binding protein
MKWMALPVLAFALALGQGAAKKGTNPAEEKAPAKAVQSIDINTATQEELKAIPGVGDVYSAKIIKGRPYKRKDELVQRGILPQRIYDKIKDRIIARQK